MRREGLTRRPAWAVLRAGIRRTRLWAAVIGAIASFAAVAANAATVPVNLAPYYNAYGIFSDAATVTNGGLGANFAYSAAQTGTSVTWQGISYTFGPANQPDVVSSAATVPLTAGQYTALNVIASTTGGQTNAQFTVVYSDGSRHVYTQSMSGWYLSQPAAAPLTGTVEPANQPFESTVLITPYGRMGGGNFTAKLGIFGYSFPLDPGRVATSVILPGGVNVFAMALVGPTASTTTTPTVVSLTAADNADAIVTDGSAVSNGGFDTSGYAYSANLLGSSITWNGVTYPLGPANGLDAVDNTTITLPAGSYSALNLIGAAAYGPRSGTIVVTYTNGASTSFTQTFSDWAQGTTPVTQAGESVAAATAYRDTSSGKNTVQPSWDIYGYSFTLNPALTVASVKLPTDPLIKFFGAALLQTAAAPAATRAVDLTSSFNVAAISSDGNTASNALYSQGTTPYTYPASALGNGVTWNGATFILGQPDVNDAVSSATVPLPAGQFGRLDVLASRVYGSSASETFTVTYTDGTTSTFTQGMHDWWTNVGNTPNYPGEAPAVWLSYLHDGAAGRANNPVVVYGYSFALNASKTVKSVTLPADPDVGVLAMNLGAANAAPAIPTAATATAVVTHHNDTWRTGQNTAEAQLTPAVVANFTGSQVFGKLGTVTLDAAVDGQPLVVPKVAVTGDPNSGTHDVVYVATRNNTVYAINPVTLTVLTSRNLGTAAYFPTTVGSCPGLNAQIGVNSTPVIDTSTNSLYVMAYVQAPTGPQWVLHRLSLADLSDIVPAVTVSASANLSNGATQAFNAGYVRQRTALLESGGNVIATFSSFCESAGTNFRGWVLGFNTTTLALNTAGVDLVNKQSSNASSYFMSSVWMSGAGAAADEAGNIYFTTGNSLAGSYDGVNAIQESAVKINPATGALLSVYTPQSVNYLDQQDMDISSGGITLLPNANERVGAVQAKDGVVRIFSRDNLGGNNDSALQFATPAGGCWCQPSYFNDGLDRLVTSGGNQINLYTWQTGSNPNLLMQGSAQIPNVQGQGTFTSITNGAGANSIIWALARPNGSTTAINLLAYQATPVNGALPLLYASGAGVWTSLFNANLVPTVANGRVYVAGTGELTIFGLGGTR
jgi:hypothetical protein